LKDVADRAGEVFDHNPGRIDHFDGLTDIVGEVLEGDRRLREQIPCVQHQD